MTMTQFGPFIDQLEPSPQGFLLSNALGCAAVGLSESKVRTLRVQLREPDHWFKDPNRQNRLFFTLAGLIELCTLAGTPRALEFRAALQLFSSRSNGNFAAEPVKLPPSGRLEVIPPEFATLAAVSAPESLELMRNGALSGLPWTPSMSGDLTSMRDLYAMELQRQQNAIHLAQLQQLPNPEAPQLISVDAQNPTVQQVHTPAGTVNITVNTTATSHPNPVVGAYQWWTSQDPLAMACIGAAVCCLAFVSAYAIALTSPAAQQRNNTHYVYPNR